MSEIDSLQNAYYYSGIQNSTNEALKKRKTEKSSSAKSTKKTKFSDFFKNKNDETKISESEFPLQINEMSTEDAVIFLKDAVDIAGNELSSSVNPENVEKFKKAVKQFISFVVKNNYEVITKKSKIPKFVSPVGMFSNYNTTPHLKNPKIQINIINEKLAQLTKETMKTQMDNLMILQKADEIKGLIIDLMSS